METTTQASEIVPRTAIPQTTPVREIDFAQQPVESPPATAFQRVMAAPTHKTVNPADIMVLQRAVGNRAVQQLIQRKTDGQNQPAGRAVDRSDSARLSSRTSASPTDATSHEALSQPTRTTISAIQRDPVDTAYGQYDSNVLAQQQQKVEQLLGKLEVIEDKLPTYALTAGAQFRAYSEVENFPDERKTPKKGKTAPQDYQGWKVHVGAKPDEAAKLAEAILPIAQKYKVMHKIVTSLMTYAMDNDPNHLGKYITIYPKDIGQLFQIVGEIEVALLTLRLNNLAAHERTASEFPLGTSGNVTTRYGSFTGDQVHVPGKEGHPFVKDDRSVTHPAGLEGEFAQVQHENATLVQSLTVIKEQMAIDKQARLERNRQRRQGGYFMPPGDFG